MTTSSLRRSIVAVTAGLFVACVGPHVTEPVREGGAPREVVGSVNLVECPTTEATSTTALVTALGGVLSAGGTSVSIPAGALLEDATVTLTVPASTYVEVDINVAGFEDFAFELPITVTLSYARCTRSDIDLSPLSVWYIDDVTKVPLYPMGGVDDKVARTVTFSTGHLSGYALAN